MDFFTVCKNLGLTRRETQDALWHLQKSFPYGEHAQLTTEEIEVEIVVWRSEMEWNKRLEESIKADYEAEFGTEYSFE